VAEQPWNAAGVAKIRPRIGRWDVAENGEVSLVGTRCTSCGESFFPERRVCGRCRSEATEEIRLKGPARLDSYTVVHQLPAGFAAPLAIGYAALGGDVLVLAPIDAAPDLLRVGMPLALRVGVTRIDDDGEPMTSYRFAPTGA